MRWTSGRSFAGAVVLAALVAGCSGASNDSPAPSPVRPSPGTTAPSGTPSSGATSPSSSPTGGTTIPEGVPAAARANTAAGAEAFARYYFDRLNAAFVDPAASSVAALATTRCMSCENFSASIKGMAARSERLDRAPYSIAAAVELPDSVPAQRVFSIVIAQAETRTMKADGASTLNKAERSTAEILVRREGTGWKIDGLANAR
jgi:hypothetical protein